MYDPKLALRIESSEEGDRLAEAIGSKRVLLQSNHGPMICAESMDVAFDYLVGTGLAPCGLVLRWCMHSSMSAHCQVTSCLCSLPHM